MARPYGLPGKLELCSNIIFNMFKYLHKFFLDGQRTLLPNFQIKTQI